jgi:heptosyltransferase III
MNRIRELGRAILLALIRLLFPRAPSSSPAIDSGQIRKLLVVRTDTRVGNVLLTTPLVRALRKGLPRARVDWLVAAGKESLVEGLADRLLPFRKEDFFRHPLRFASFVLGLRRERYDVVIEAGHWHAFSFTSLWLTRFTAAPIRIGHARGLADRFLTHLVERDPAHLREVAAKLELLGPLGMGSDGEQMDTTVDRDPRVQQAAAAIVPPEGPQLVVLNPGARKPSHRWPAQNYGELARRLQESHGVRTLVLWGPGEEELARQVEQASGGAATLAPPTNLALLAAVFRRSALVVTNDTGPMHLAVATGAPVVAVLMAEDGGRWSHARRFAGVPVRAGSADEVQGVLEAVRAQLEPKPGGG